MGIFAVSQVAFYVSKYASAPAGVMQGAQSEGGWTRQPLPVPADGSGHGNELKPLHFNALWTLPHGSALQSRAEFEGG